MARSKQMMSYRQENQNETQAGRTTVVRSATPPTSAAIEARAYQIFLARGSNPGTSSDDWFQAERELAAEGPSIDE